MKHRPPKGAQRLLTWFSDEYWVDELLGDLDEEYEDNVSEVGRRRATISYYWQVMLLLRPHIIKKGKQTQSTPFMLRNYIKSAYRSLLKNKVYGAINISGLAVGITCCLLISLYVLHETSYDKFFKDGDRIYRVALERIYPTNTRFFGTSPVNLAPTLSENYGEVEVAARFFRIFFLNQLTVNFGDRSFLEKNYLFADNNFFRVFSFDFIEGDPSTALDNPNKVVLTESIVRKYFGEELALNKTYRIDTSQYIVSGVVRDVPSNSHLTFDLLGSIHSLPFLEQAAETNSWINPWLYTYIKLRDEVAPVVLEEKLPQMVKTYGLASILRQLQLSADDYPDSGHDFHYFLQPLEDIHLHSNLDIEVKPNGNIMYVYLLSAVVAFILIISCINFINLATARSAERAKEVGVRKVMGSSRSLLVKQFLTESNLIALVALLVALGVTWLVLPSFNALVSKDLSFLTVLEPTIILGLVGLVFVVGTLAGLYPAVVISSINSALVLKGKYRTSGKGVWLRNALIVFQFFISITMISGTLLLNNQMDFMRNKQLGFSKENVIVIEQAQVLGQQMEVFRNQINQIDGVFGMGSGFAMPGDFIGNLIVNSEDPETPQLRTFTNTVDEDYIPALGMEVIAGRNFDRNFNDSLNVIVNETAARLLGYGDAVGRKIINTNLVPNQPNEFNIVGVIKDYHHQSLHTEIPPIIIFNVSNSAQGSLPNVAVRIDSEKSFEILRNIEKTWSGLETDQPIAYTFLDDNLENLYQSDLQSGKIFSLFTAVTIVMACVGLFGLAAYVTQQRTKEIGIRKVLGASISGIIMLLSKDFTKLIAIAFLASLPLVYYGINEWLESFAYRTGIDVFTLLGSGLLTLILAWLTISYYAIKIAVLNPVKSLRSE